MPLIDECLDSLVDNVFMSALDLTSGYFQILLHPNDCHKTAFSTRFGLYEHCHMAQGLTGAPSTFQRAMNLVLRGLTYKTVLAFLDDILVLGRSFDEHLQNLDEVFTRLKKYNLKLSPRKCKLFARELEFLGHKVSADMVGIQESKVQTIKDWIKPASVNDVQTLLGFANYHRGHIDHYADIVKPLYDACKTSGKRRFL